MRKHRLLLPAMAILAALAGCGGGVSVGFGDDWYDERPEVSLVVSTETAAPGEDFVLAAAASDDDHVDEVRFYRRDPDGHTTHLGTDHHKPFEWTTALPASAEAGSRWRYFARAEDSIGQTRDSDEVVVTAE